MVDGRALVDGAEYPLEQATLPLLDEGVARGDGAFETIGVWDGHPYRLGDHLDRLDGSLERILLPPADREALAGDIARLLDGLAEDAALRCYVTATGTRVTTLSPLPPHKVTRHLVPVHAPWIVPVQTYAPAGAKTMSYGANMTATRAALRAGGDDALLVDARGTALEGPTFCVLWVVAGVLHAVPPECGIVDSISRRALLELAADDGIPARVSTTSVEALGETDEVLICSSARPPAAMARVGPHRFDGPAPVTQRLAAALDDARRGRR